MADQGGDPACWADRVCPECGAFIEDDSHACVESPEGDGDPQVS